MEDFLAPPKPPAKRNFQRKFALRRFKTESLLLGRKIVVNGPASNAIAKQKESAHVLRKHSLILSALLIENSKGV